jgi:hypothetical protein
MNLPAHTHHHRFALHLTGPAGGSYVPGGDGPTVDIDAIDWAWTVSSRAPGAGLLANSLPL